MKGSIVGLQSEGSELISGFLPALNNSLSSSIEKMPLGTLLTLHVQFSFKRETGKVRTQLDHVSFGRT